MSKGPGYRSVGGMRTVAELRAHANSLGLELPLNEADAPSIGSVFAQPARLNDGFVIGNRFCIHPMEGWDGTPDGKPTELTFRRWRRFGQSGAKLIWGGEAAAVAHDGRANANQLLVNAANGPDLARLRQALVDAHQTDHHTTSDLLVGLQLTHSGRFARPDGAPRPIIAYRHPVLDRRLPDDGPSEELSDARIGEIAKQFVNAAVVAQDAGFQFVDIKHCHGYLGHELLSATTRPGAHGGSIENRTRFLHQVVDGIRQRAPRLRIGVRVSVFDMPPFHGDADGKGIAEAHTVPYPHAFGADATDPTRFDPTEVEALLGTLQTLGIELINVTVGSPYYNPHIQRPALFPPSDGYLPPEDPLCGVARQIRITAHLKQRFQNMRFVGSGYSYLQQWIGPVGAAVIGAGHVDFVGLGRMALSYPQLPADIMQGRQLNRRFFCRTFSDCTTAPRNGMVSGCFPLDPFYREQDTYVELKRVKRAMEGAQ